MATFISVFPVSRVSWRNGVELLYLITKGGANGPGVSYVVQKRMEGIYDFVVTRYADIIHPCMY